MKIKRTLMWLYLLAKRYFKNIAFVIVMLLIPVCVLTLRGNTGKDEGIIKLALYVEEPRSNPWADQIVKTLLDESDSTVYFYQLDSEEELKQNVISDKALCGYCFPADFEKAVKKYAIGEKSELPYENALIKCYQKDSGNFIEVANEIVFTAMYEPYSREIQKNFVNSDTERGTDDLTEEDWKLIEEYFNSYDISDDLFTYMHVDGTEVSNEKQSKVSIMMLPVRGLILTLIFIAAMTGGVVLFRDKEKGVFQAITMSRRGILNYMYIFIPGFIAGVVGVAGIYFAGLGTGILNEVFCMFAYILLITGMGNIVRRLCRNVNFFVSCIPIYALLNLIFCPVFVDVSIMVPVAGVLKKMLPVYYGLSCIYDTHIKIGMIVAGAILMLSMIKDKE